MIRRPFLYSLLLFAVALGSVHCTSTMHASDAEAADVEAEANWLSAGFLLLPGTYGTELVAPWDVLEHVQYHTDGGIRVFTVSPTSDPVATAEGLRVVPDHTFDNHPAIDILIVPSAENSRDKDLSRADVVTWVETIGGDAQYVMSLCWGAFVLAESGLLDGKSCTTYPSDYETLARRYPSLDVRVNASFVHDGNAITSQGGRLSYDAALYLVEHLFGRDVATGVSNGLLVPWPPQEQPRPTFVSDGPATVQAPD